MDFNVIDAGVAAVIVLAVQTVKKHLPRKYWHLLPLLPFLLGIILALPLVIVTHGSVPPLVVLLSASCVEGLKLGSAAIVAFNLGHKTKREEAEADVGSNMA